MTYYEDLTSCDYFELDGPALTAVGWLEPGHYFAQGPVSPQFLEKLRQLLEFAWGPCFFAGGQHCRFCGEAYGYQNLFVPCGQGFLVAPQLIVHYIVQHNYLPPAIFQEAVRLCPTMLSEEYFAEVEQRGYPVPREQRQAFREIRDASPPSVDEWGFFQS